MRKPTDQVYVIGNPGCGTVKIGIANDSDRRLREIATGWHPWAVDPQKLEILKLYRLLPARRLETALHATFATSRLRLPGSIRTTRRHNENLTEWFKLGGNAVGRIDCVVSRWAARWEEEVA